MPSTHTSALSSLYAPARSAVGFGQERPPGRLNALGEFSTTSPRGAAKRPQVGRSWFGGPGWVPRLHPWFRGCPCPTDGVRRERQGRPTVMGPDGLMDDRNGSGHICHLLPNTAFRLTANSKSALKAQEEVVFSQVSLLLHRSVASL